MRNAWTRLAALLGSDDGPTPVQYALLLLLAVLTCLTLIAAVGHRTAVGPSLPDAAVTRPAS